MAEKIVVELDAYVIGKEHRVFKCSPGKTYRFYKEVRRANTVFLDIRDLDKLPKSTADWHDENILKIIADDRWNREIQSRERGNDPQGTQGVGRADKTKLGFLKALLFEAQRGDLVIVPVEGYNKDVLIGEFLDDAGDVRPIVATDDETQFAYLGRRVRWRSAMPKRFLSEQMIKAIHTQTAFFMIGQSLREEVYRLAYQNFVYRGDFAAEFRTSKEKFTAEDHAVVSTWLNGFDVARSLGEAIDPSISFFELGLRRLDDNLAAEIRIDIQSPGGVFVKSTGPFAMALMVLFSLPGCDTKKVVDEGVTVKLKVVGGAANPKDEIAQCVKSIAIALGQTRLDQSCALSDRAAKDAKITTSAALKSPMKGSK